LIEIYTNKIFLNPKIVFSVYNHRDKKKIYNILLILFSKFRSFRVFNSRYLTSRFELLNLVKRFSFLSNFSYCFSHAKQYSAVLVSSIQLHTSIDIEPRDRKISKYLKSYIQSYFPEVGISDIRIISILECLIKLSAIDSLIDPSGGLKSMHNVKMDYRKNIVYTGLEGGIFYSTFFDINGQCVCITTKDYSVLKNITHCD